MRWEMYPEVRVVSAIDEGGQPDWTIGVAGCHGKLVDINTVCWLVSIFPEAILVMQDAFP